MLEAQTPLLGQNYRQNSAHKGYNMAIFRFDLAPWEEKGPCGVETRRIGQSYGSSKRFMMV